MYSIIMLLKRQKVLSTQYLCVSGTRDAQADGRFFGMTELEKANFRPPTPKHRPRVHSPKSPAKADPDPTTAYHSSRDATYW